MAFRKRMHVMFFLARSLIFIWGKIWLRFRRVGYEKVPSEGACIVAANHVSYLDPPFVGASVQHRIVRFMARDTLMSNFVMRWLFPRFHIVPIDRDRGDVAALRQGLSTLKLGGVLGLFPEGTRSPDGQLKEAKGGIGFLIAKAKVPVIPVYVDGTYDAFPKGAKWVKPGKVTVYFGDPIPPEELVRVGKGREAYEKIGQVVMNHIAAIRDQHCPKERKAD